MPGNGPLPVGWNPLPALIGSAPATGTFTVSGASPNAQGYLVSGNASAFIPLSAGNTLYVNPSTATITPFQFDSTGNFTFYNVTLYNINNAGSNIFLQVAEQIPGQPSGNPSSYRVTKLVQAVIVR